MEQRIETMTVREAAEILRGCGMSTTAETLRRGIEQGVFPFADYVKLDKGPVYYVYTKLLREWIAERTEMK